MERIFLIHFTYTVLNKLGVLNTLQRYKIPFVKYRKSFQGTCSHLLRPQAFFEQLFSRNIFRYRVTLLGALPMCRFFFQFKNEQISVAFAI